MKATLVSIQQSGVVGSVNGVEKPVIGLFTASQTEGVYSMYINGTHIPIGGEFEVKDFAIGDKEFYYIVA